MSATDDLRRLLTRAGSKPLDLEYQRLVQNAYKKALLEIDDRIRKIYEKYGDNVPDWQMYQRNRLTKLRSDIMGHLNDAYKTSRKAVKSAIKSGYEEQYSLVADAYNSVLGKFGQSVAFGAVDAKVIFAAVVNPNDKITGYIFKNLDANGKWKWEGSLKDVNARAFKKIDEAIIKGLSQGDGFIETSRAVKKAIFGTKKLQFNVTKSVQRIIRTESMKARSLGDVLAYEKLSKRLEKTDINIRRVWVSSDDKKTRDSHLQLHNIPENSDKQWLVNGTPADGPRLTGVAGEDINCRCFTVTEVEGLNSTYTEN